MKKSTLYYLALVVVVFLLFITLGGLGNIAAQQHFYWLAFVGNLVIYPLVLWNLWKAIQKEEKKEEGN